MYEVPGRSEVEKVLDSVGDEVSRKIIRSLSANPKTAGEISLETGIPVPTVYRRISELKSAGLVSISSFTIEAGKKEAIHFCTFKEILWATDGGQDKVQVRPSRTGVGLLWMRLFSKT